MMNGYVKMMIISSDANSDSDTRGSRFGAGGLILSENYLAYRYSSSYSDNNSNSIVGVFSQFVSKQTTLNNPTKIKFYSHTGSTVMNEGLFWTETIMNPGKTT